MNKDFMTNLLKNILIFAALLILANYVVNYFFINNEPQALPPVQILTDKNSYSIHENLIATIKNNTENEVNIVHACNTPPITLQKFVLSSWQDIDIDQIANTSAQCTGNQISTIAAGESLEISFIEIKNDIFAEPSKFRILLETSLNDSESVTTIESGEIEFKNIGLFMWLWQILLYQPIYNGLIYLASIMPEFSLGLAIIALTILIRTILLLPNQKALKAQKSLQNLQPHLENLKEKHGDNKEKIALETMALYKQHKVNPFGSCLPLLLQLPILLAIFQVINNGIGDTHLLYGFLQSFDISQINPSFLWLNLTETDFIALPIIVGLLQFAQMKITMQKNKKLNEKKKKNLPSELEIMNKTMIYVMPAMIAVFTASVPSGVGLYWAISTSYGIAQQAFINKQLRDDTTQIRVIDSQTNSADSTNIIDAKDMNDANSAVAKDSSEANRKLSKNQLKKAKYKKLNQK